MKERKLLRSIGQIDENLILEAEFTRFSPRKRSIFWEIAACLVLLGCLSLVIAVPRFLSREAISDPCTADPQITLSPEVPEFSFNGLCAGMSQEQVLELLGEPEQITEEDSPRWFYPSLTVQFHSLDQKVCNIWLLEGCDLTMPNGIGVGSSESELQKAYPDALTMQDYPKTSYVQDAVTEDMGGYIDHPEDMLYQINTQELTLQIGVHEERIEFIFLLRYVDPTTVPEVAADTALSLGGISMDMTQEQVRSILGEPQQLLVKEDLCWIYPTLVINFHEFDQTVSHISTMTGCELTLSNGICLGSAEEDVQNAFPEAYVNTDYHENNADTCYEVYFDSQVLLIGTADAQVVYIGLSCHADPMLEALTTESIIIYTPVDAGRSWQSVTATGRAAKGICTVLTISEPEAPGEEKTDFLCWLDFGNGTALNLYGNDTAAIYTYSGEALDPSRTDGLTWHLSGCFPDLDRYVSRALEDPT